MPSDLEKLAEAIRSVGSETGPVRPSLDGAAKAGRDLTGALPSGDRAAVAVASALQQAAASAASAASALAAFNQRAGAAADRLAAPRSGGASIASAPNETAQALARPLNGFPTSDPIRLFASRIPPKPGYYDVMGHGNQNVVELVDATTRSTNVLDGKGLASLLRQSPDYQSGPVRLLSCSTGATDDGVAQQLATSLGEPVEAPTDTLYIWADGQTHVGKSLYDKSGTWRTFRPNEEGHDT